MTMTSSQELPLHKSEEKKADLDDEQGKNDEEMMTLEECLADTSSSTVPSASSFHRRTWLVVALIIIVGAGSFTGILLLGLQAARRDQEAAFNRVASDLLNEFESALIEYEVAGLWLHQACYSMDPLEKSHEEVQAVYRYLLSTELEFQAVSFAMNVTHEERPAIENATRAFLSEKYPDIDYQGFNGFELNPETGKMARGVRSPQDYYLPIHFLEPLSDPKNRAALDFDLKTSPTRTRAIEAAVATGRPAVTERLKLIQETEFGTEAYAYSVILMHPGPKDNVTASQRPSWGVLAIRIPEVLIRTRENFQLNAPVRVHIFDATESIQDPPFMGGAHFIGDGEPGGHELQFTPEVTYSQALQDSSDYVVTKHLPFASRNWDFVVSADEGTYKPDVVFVCLSAAVIFFACICLAFYVMQSSRKVAKMNELRAQAEAEKANLRVDSARRVAQNERQLNDFLAHEVRNPLAAAISACSFVSSSVQETESLISEESKKAVREDVRIIDNSLQFINELLRNMLDLHRTSNKAMKLNVEYVDVLRDVLDPVATMLYKRGHEYSVEVDCPSDLVIKCDKMRLKQIVLNLGRNAVKFVQKGFVRLCAASVDGNVSLFIEDSGCGIPIEKRSALFAKFQESLDSLNQGTGIGLSLSKNLVDLMGGEIYLDDVYDSGVEGCIGTRFIIDLKTTAIEWKESDDQASSKISPTEESIPEQKRLPETLTVLFVDDDFVLRKLFKRSVKRIQSKWEVQEASNGETALRMVESQEFDCIFVDQYMASFDKQLLGTETVRELRAKGVKSIICGLSANDLERSFLNAGADSFMAKPFPCKDDELIETLARLLESRKVDHQV